MSNINQKWIEQLKEFEYFFRDGMVFDEMQLREIRLVCREIIELAQEKLN